MTLTRQMLLGMSISALVLIASLQSVAPVYPASPAHSSDCIPDSGCPKGGIKNENCCMEPPCEAKRQLKIAKAFRILRLGRTSSGSAGFRAEYNADVNKIRSLIPPCEETYNFRPPPPFRADPKNECTVGIVESNGSMMATTRDEAVQEINSCAEVIKAQFAFAEATQPWCERKMNGENLEDSYKLSESLRANQAQLDSLDADFLRYFSVCSIVPDSELARELADATISALLNGQPTDAPKKAPPGKSRNSGK